LGRAARQERQVKLRAAAALLGRDVRRGRKAIGAEHERQGAAERSQEEERCFPWLKVGDDSCNAERELTVVCQRREIKGI